MTAHFLRSYSQLLIKTCHRRDVHAMGGMAAQIPIKDDPAANEEAHGQGARRQAARGGRRPRRHLGGASRPGADRQGRVRRVMPEANQIARKRQDVHVDARPTCSRCPTGAITEAGLRQNINVGIGYLEAWLRGIGCVPLYNLMEDAATAEISRAQVWQWMRHGQTLDDGRLITRELVREIVREELEKVKAQIGDEPTPRAATTRRPSYVRPGRAAAVRRVPDPAGLRPHRCRGEEGGLRRGTHGK